MSTLGPHLAVGAAAGLAAGAVGAAAGLPVDPLTGAIVGAVGAALPDSDSPAGWLRFLGWRGVRLAGGIRWLTYPPARAPGFAALPPDRKGHRGLLHSGAAAVALLAVALLPVPLVAPLGPDAVARLAGAAVLLGAGYLSHLLLDAADARGIPLGAPVTWRRWRLRLRRGRVRVRVRGGRGVRIPPRMGAPAQPSRGQRGLPPGRPRGGTLPPDYVDAAWRVVAPEPLPGPRAAWRG